MNLHSERRRLWCCYSVMQKRIRSFFFFYYRFLHPKWSKKLNFVSKLNWFHLKGVSRESDKIFMPFRLYRVFCPIQVMTSNLIKMHLSFMQKSMVCRNKIFDFPLHPLKIDSWSNFSKNVWMLLIRSRTARRSYDPWLLSPAQPQKKLLMDITVNHGIAVASESTQMLYILWPIKFSGLIAWGGCDLHNFQMSAIWEHKIEIRHNYTQQGGIPNFRVHFFGFIFEAISIDFHISLPK